MDHSAYHTLVQENLCTGISDHLSVLKFSVDEMEFTSAIPLQSRFTTPTPERRRVDDTVHNNFNHLLRFVLSLQSLYGSIILFAMFHYLLLIPLATNYNKLL